MRKTIILFVVGTFCLGAAVSGAQTPGPVSAGPVRLDTDEQKTFYALGLLLGDDVKVFDLKPEDLAIVKAGMTDAVTGAVPQVDIDTFGPKVNDLARSERLQALTMQSEKGRSSPTKLRWKRTQRKPRPEL
jgi:FKBP-type peptidyl-prolyl cis-trans isomerase FkpA